MHATWELPSSVMKCGFTKELSIEVTVSSCGKSTHNGMKWKPLFITNDVFFPPLKRSAHQSSLMEVSAAKSIHYSHLNNPALKLNMRAFRKGEHTEGKRIQFRQICVLVRINEHHSSVSGNCNKRRLFHRFHSPTQ